MSLIAELKRRKVFKLGAAYLVVAWLAVQAASIAFPAFEAPPWALRVFIFVAVLGFPVALLAAWLVELTPEGMRLDRAPTGSRRMYAIVGVLAALGIAWFFRGQFASRAPDDGPRTLAVLPFASLGQDADSSGLAGGLHDTLITQLSKLKGLEVRSRTSVMKFKDWNGGLRPIAKELGVAVVLEGSVQRQGNRTVVNAQLIDALTDAHLWAETFDRTGDDLFALQADIAQKVAQSLQVTLSPGERDALTHAPTENKQAYALYLQAQHVLAESVTLQPYAAMQAALQRGVELLEAAVAADPKFALGWATLSRAYATVAWSTRGSGYAQVADQARRAAERAATFGADLPEAHYASGSVALQLDFDFPRAVRELELAVQGAPGDAAFHQQLGVACRYAGQFEGAERAFRRAHELDPTEIVHLIALQGSMVTLRRDDEARQLAREAAALRPDSYFNAAGPAELEQIIRGDLGPIAAFVRANADRFRAQQGWTEHRWLVAMAEGAYAEALDVLDQAPKEARPDGHDAYRGETLRRLGREDDARAAFRAGLDELQSGLRGQIDPYLEAGLRTYVAYVQARLGDVAEARGNVARAAGLWGIDREPMDGARLWMQLAGVHGALGETDAACAKLKQVFDRRTIVRGGRVWTEYELAELHNVPCVRALLQAEGIDVSKEPFAFNRAAALKAGG